MRVVSWCVGAETSCCKQNQLNLLSRGVLHAAWWVRSNVVHSKQHSDTAAWCLWGIVGPVCTQDQIIFDNIFVCVVLLVCEKWCWCKLKWVLLQRTSRSSVWLRTAGMLCDCLKFITSVTLLSRGLFISASHLPNTPQNSNKQPQNSNE